MYYFRIARVEKLVSQSRKAGNRAGLPEKEVPPALLIHDVPSPQSF